MKNSADRNFADAGLNWMKLVGIDFYNISAFFLNFYKFLLFDIYRFEVMLELFN